METFTGYSGVVTHATTSAYATAIQNHDRLDGLGVIVTSAYAATAATTGCKLFLSVSYDGTNYTDAILVATTAPTPSQGVATSSTVFADLTAYKAATYFKFKVQNLDGTNDATVTATMRGTF